ncbi:uncharacterized protein RHO25_010907 [Cercospora beticola]|uniref:Uncharacterized protein n=1 Tax=Cercospora beticola TaxID=122368 RepID=A0ABZ0P383_CERBT|nr:hypothetical protein RHO25_010907 [Cercospora beticola]
MLSILFLLCAAVLEGVRAQVEAKPKSTVRVQITQRIQLTKTIFPSGVSAGVQDTTTATPAVAGGVQFTVGAGNDAVPTTTSDEPRVILMGSITLTEGGPAQTNAGQVYSIDACTIYAGTARDNICDSNGRPTTESWTTSSAYPGITSDPATPTTTSWTFTIGTQAYTMGEPERRPRTDGKRRVGPRLGSELDDIEHDQNNDKHAADEVAVDEEQYNRGINGRCPGLSHAICQ